ncbi:MAG: DUF2510 domain-containing protein [Actinomycetota bacterium]
MSPEDPHGDDATRPASNRAGWFPDPLRRHEFRFHNGGAWTADVSDDGRRFVDPFGAAPGPWDAEGPSDAPRLEPGGGRNRIAVAGLVCGVIGLSLAFIPFLFVIGAVAAVLAIVFGAVGLRRSRPTGRRRGAAIAGLVTGVVGVLGAVVGGFLTSALISAIDDYENPGQYELGPVSCTNDGSAWTAAGSITNGDEETRSYTLSVDFVRPGTDNVRTRVRVRLDDIDPMASDEFEVRRVVDLDEIDCVVSAVDGPPPFGLDLGG